MAADDGDNPETGEKPAGNRSGARRSHSIRFPDSEWSLIERAAGRHGIPAGELVCAGAGAIALAENRSGESPPATVTPGHLALVQTMPRMVHVLATLNRDRSLDAGRKDDLDELVAEAREAMQETMIEGPTRPDC